MPTLQGSTGIINTSTMTTAGLVVHTINEASDGNDTLTGLKAGLDSTKFRTVIICTMPQAYQVYGTTVDARYDGAMTIKNVQLSFSCNNADAVNNYNLYYLPITHWGAQDDASPTETPQPSWNFHDSVNDSLSWTAGCPIDTSTDYGLGANGIIDYIFPKTANPSTYTFNTSGLIKAKNITWGDTFALVIASDDEANGNHITGATGLTTNDVMNMQILFDDTMPSKAVIKLSAGDDFLDAILTYQTKPTDADIVAWRHVWKSGAADTVNNINGVNYDTTAANNTAIYNFGKDQYKQSDGDIASGFLSSAGTQYHLVSFTQDQTAYNNVTGTQSNIVSKKRMTCSGSLSAGTAIGQELTLTITGSGGDFSGKFVKFGVNWDGDATPANDSIDDYTIVTLDEASTTATVKHTYHKADTYKVNICTIDADGFRSDFTLAESRTIDQSNPVAVLRASRDTAVRARYGDDFSIINLSLSHSYPVGSDRILMTHRFKHNSTRPLTTFPTDNDNSNFNDASTSVAVKCNKASCDDTIIKVFGKVSVDSDGDPIADDHVNFDHYEFQVHQVSPHTNIDTIGGVATTTDSTGSTVSVFYKQVDFVAISTLSGDDDGVLYTLVDIKDDHSSGDAADAGFGNIINNKIRGKKDTYAWGGYEDLTANITEVNFDASAGTITRDAGSGDFITNGATVGDTIYIAGPENAGNNGFFTLSAVTGTVLTVNETLTNDDDADTAAQIYKIAPPVIPFAAYDGTDATITASVISTVVGQSTTADLDTSSEVTQDIIIVNEEQNSLDLDTIADSGDIAILNANLNRSGGLASQMALGGRTYPIGATRTRMGEPTLALSVRVLTQAGYRQIWNLIEGGRYEWITIDSKKVDLPSTAYKQLRMRLVNGTIDKDTTLASQYLATLNFVVIGELVT